MNITHLKYLYDVCRLESVQGAARLNHVAPSTISQALRALEVEFGCPLTAKTRGGLGLLPAALELASRVPQLLNQVEDLRNLHRKKESKLQGKLRIATHQSLLAYFLWKVIRRFKKEYPEVEFGIVSGVGSHLSSLVAQNQVDLCVSLTNPDPSLVLHSKVLHRGNFVLAGKNTKAFHPNSQVLVTNHAQPEVRSLVKNNPWLQTEEAVNWSTIKGVLSTEEVFGYLPDYLIQKELEDGYLGKITKVKKANHPYAITSWFTAEQALNPLVRKFHELLI